MADAINSQFDTSLVLDAHSTLAHATVLICFFHQLKRVHASLDTLEELVDYNSKLKKMRRTLTYLSNVTSEMERLPAVHANKGHRHLVHDVYEQFDRLRTMSDLFQELVVDLMNGYLSLSAHRLNQIMKVLTVFTVIFLPLTLMVGIYGMNFEYIPELGWRYGYFALLGGMATVVLVAVVVFRWKRWL